MFMFLKGKTARHVAAVFCKDPSIRWNCGSNKN